MERFQGFKDGSFGRFNKDRSPTSAFAAGAVVRWMKMETD